MGIEDLRQLPQRQGQRVSHGGEAFGHGLGDLVAERGMGGALFGEQRSEIAAARLGDVAAGREMAIEKGGQAIVGGREVGSVARESVVEGRGGLVEGVLHGRRAFVHHRRQQVGTGRHRVMTLGEQAIEIVVRGVQNRAGVGHMRGQQLRQIVLGLGQRRVVPGHEFADAGRRAFERFAGLGRARVDQRHGVVGHLPDPGLAFAAARRGAARSAIIPSR